MAVSRVIEVSFGRSSVALVRIDTAYFYNNGILFKPTDIDLPASYQVHWADSPQASTTLETIGTAEGAQIPDDLWNRSRVIYGWIYLHPTEDSGVTGYEVRIYKNVRAGLPDGTEPTPAEQSTIDQLIGALNSAVEQTGEDVESASASAQSASDDADRAESARNAAQGYVSTVQGYANSAQTSASQASTSATASAQSASQSAQIKADVEDLVDDAQASADASAQSASQASTSEQGCARAVLDAASAAAIARARAEEASGYAQTASAKAQDASGYAQTASAKATESAQSATNASQSAQTAEQAKTASQTAQGLAESARDSAVQAKTDAESAKADAESARDEAQQAVASISGALADKAPVITDTASGSIASFSDGADDLPLKSLVIDINPVQDLSHGDPSPENICPISGWTSVGVNQFAVNVWDEEWEVGGINVDNGKNVTATDRIRSKNYISVVPGVSYYFKSSNTIGLRLYDGDKHYVTSTAPTNLAYTIPANIRYVRFIVLNTTTYNHDISINYPSTDHDYHPYTGRSITISLGQTVYGGKLDVLSGELVIDRAMATFDGSESGWGWYPDYKQAYINGVLSNAPARYVISEVTHTCNIFKPVSNNGRVYSIGNYSCLIGSGNGVAFSYDVNTVDEFKSFVQNNPIQFCYELATPIEIQLSPNQINSLLGVNNIWADSGDTEVEYRADTKLFIERLTAPDSEDMIADANITSGQYFMVGNSLYKATANIANGSAIIVGTNAVRKSLSEALNEINV